MTHTILAVVLASAEGTTSRGFPWLLLIVLSFVTVLLHTLYRLRRSRRAIADGMRLMDEGRTDEAAVFFERAAARDKSDVIVRFHLGLCRELMGDAAGAAGIYQELIDDPRCDFAARTRLAEVKQGRLIDKQKLRALGHFEEGVGLLASGDVHGAANAFAEGTTLHPAYRPIHYYLGVCAEINARPNEAIEHYRRLLEDEKEPTLANHRILAVRARKLWTLDDAPIAIRLRKAWNYLQIDDIPRAIDELEAVLAAVPDEHTAHFGLASCHLAGGKRAQAREHYEQVPPDDFRYQNARERLAELDAGRDQEEKE